MTIRIRGWVELMKVCVKAVATVGVRKDSQLLNWKHSLKPRLLNHFLLIQQVKMSRCIFSIAALSSGLIAQT